MIIIIIDAVNGLCMREFSLPLINLICTHFGMDMDIGLDFKITKCRND